MSHSLVMRCSLGSTMSLMWRSVELRQFSLTRVLARLLVGLGVACRSARRGHLRLDVVSWNAKNVYQEQGLHTGQLQASLLIYVKGTSGEVTIVLMLVWVGASGNVAPNGSRLCLIFFARGRRTLPEHRRLQAGP